MTAERNRITEYLRDKAAFALSKRRLKELMKSDELDDVLESIGKYRGRGFYDRIRLAQDYGELRSLCNRVIEKKPKVIAEIGTWNGGTFYVWCRINPQAKKIISIDLPGGDYGGGYDEKRIKFFREFTNGNKNTKLEFIRGDSKSQEVRNKLTEILAGDRIDFLYIDGDHTYGGIKNDFEIYLTFMANDGMIGFHDINTFKEGYGVHKLWNEVKTQYRHEEFIKPGSMIMGNGLLYLGS